MYRSWSTTFYSLYSLGLVISKYFLKNHFICTLMTPSCTSLSLLQILLYLLNHIPPFTDIFFWMKLNNLLLNSSKTEYLLSGTKQQRLKFSYLAIYLSAMISAHQPHLLAILASSLTLTCHSLIKSTLYPNLVIFISETSVEFVISFLFLQPQWDFTEETILKIPTTETFSYLQGNWNILIRGSIESWLFNWL